MFGFDRHECVTLVSDAQDDLRHGRWRLQLPKLRWTIFCRRLWHCTWFPDTAVRRPAAKDEVGQQVAVIDMNDCREDIDESFEERQLTLLEKKSRQPTSCKFSLCPSHRSWKAINEIRSPTGGNRSSPTSSLNGRPASTVDGCSEIG